MDMVVVAQVKSFLEVAVFWMSTHSLIALDDSIPYFLSEQEKLSIQLEKEKLEHLALQVKQRSADIEDMVLVSYPPL